MADLKTRILEEMVIDDESAWNLAKEIYEKYRSVLKPRIGLSEIYNRIIELKKEAQEI